MQVPYLFSEESPKACSSSRTTDPILLKHICQSDILLVMEDTAQVWNLHCNSSGSSNSNPNLHTSLKTIFTYITKVCWSLGDQTILLLNCSFRKHNLRKWIPSKEKKRKNSSISIPFHIPKALVELWTDSLVISDLTEKPTSLPLHFTRVIPAPDKTL